VTPTVTGNDARGRNASSIFRLQIAASMVVAILMTGGCSSNSPDPSSIKTPLPAATATSADPWTVFSSNPQVAQILASSCFDCHSEQNDARWYVKIAPSYWFSGSARKTLNFTGWNQYSEERRSDEIAEIGRAVNRGEMPPWDYTVFHPAAELTNEQKDAVSEWAASHVEVLPAH
jgi:mono/diheme cytochrome c family protein